MTVKINGLDTPDTRKRENVPLEINLFEKKLGP